jgi:hypothetical protein
MASCKDGPLLEGTAELTDKGLSNRLTKRHLLDQAAKVQICPQMSQRDADEQSRIWDLGFQIEI